MSGLKDHIDFLERVCRYGPPDETDLLYVQSVIEEALADASILAGRLGVDLGDVPAMPTPQQALAVLGRLQSTPRDVLTVTQAARLLQVSRDKVLGWINSGRLPAMNTGGRSRPRYRVARGDLDGFLSSGHTRRSCDKPARRPRATETAAHYFPER
jgi:excisionase family DNA binding protein